MVSIIGYSVGEMLYAAIASYVLLLLIVVTQWMTDRGDQLPAKRLSLISASIFSILLVGQLLPIRIGTIMFVNGFLFAVWCVVCVRGYLKWVRLKQLDLVPQHYLRSLQKELQNSGREYPGSNSQSISWEQFQEMRNGYSNKNNEK